MMYKEGMRNKHTTSNQGDTTMSHECRCDRCEMEDEQCDDCRHGDEFTRWLVPTLEAIVEVAAPNGWDDCDGFDTLESWLREARREGVRPESVYITLEHGSFENEDRPRLHLRISDHSRNVFRGRATGQSEVDCSLAIHADGGDAGLGYLKELLEIDQ